MRRVPRSLRFVVALFLALVVVAVPGTPSAADGQKAGSALNMEAVGHNDLGGRGFNGDVFVHDGVAYVGHWGFTDHATGNIRFCPEEPNSGVAVLDVGDPADPTVVSHLQNPSGTSAEDVVAYTAPYRDSGFVALEVSDPASEALRHRRFNDTGGLGARRCRTATGWPRA